MLQNAMLYERARYDVEVEDVITKDFKENVEYFAKIQSSKEEELIDLAIYKLSNNVLGTISFEDDDMRVSDKRVYEITFEIPEGKRLVFLLQDKKVSLRMLCNNILEYIDEALGDEITTEGIEPLVRFINKEDGEFWVDLLDRNNKQVHKEFSRAKDLADMITSIKELHVI